MNTMDSELDLLMEKLRSRAGMYKSYREYSKSVRMTLLERRHALDPGEKSQYQQCLDVLQRNIMTSSLPSIVERLEVISRHLGLKFVAGPSGLDWFLSSDMFYLEVLLTSNGNVTKVKIHHDGSTEQEDCEELMRSLSNKEFKDFTEQLEGLISMYNLQAEKKIKSLAFLSLQYLEADIITLSEKSPYYNKTYEMIYKSHFGYIQKRSGGHPMRLVYFTRPYELLDIPKVNENSLNFADLPASSYTLSITLETSDEHDLQTSTLVNVKDTALFEENTLPCFEEMTSSNTTKLPACFSMKLKEPMPICEEFIKKIVSVTGMDVKKFGYIRQLLPLIKQQVVKKYTLSEKKSSLVILPDQQHYYVLSENTNLRGYLVNSIPFTHPEHIFKVLPILRQQALFNTLIASCIRFYEDKENTDSIDSKNPKLDYISNSLNWKNSNFSILSDLNSNTDSGSKLNAYNQISGMFSGYQDDCSSFNCEFPDEMSFELCAVSCHHISISFEHPLQESFLTVELDLTNIPDIECNVQMPIDEGDNCEFKIQDFVMLAFRRSFSIPASIRTLLYSWETSSDVINDDLGNNNEVKNEMMDFKNENGGSAFNEKDGESKIYEKSEFGPPVTIKLEKIEDHNCDHPPLDNNFSSEPEKSSSDMISEGELDFQQFVSLDQISTSFIDLNFTGSNADQKPINDILDQDDFKSFFKEPHQHHGRTFDLTTTIKEEPIDSENVIDNSLISIKLLTSPDNKNNGCGNSGLIDPLGSLVQDMRTSEEFDKTSSVPTGAGNCDLTDVVNELKKKIGDSSTDNFLKFKNVLQKENFKSNLLPGGSGGGENKKSLSIVLSDIESKNLISPSVSITPVAVQNSKNLNTATTATGGGIEIIPLTTPSPTQPPPQPILPSSLTITPIAFNSNNKDGSEKIGSSISSKDKSEKKKRKHSSEGGKIRDEKRKKRKHRRDGDSPTINLPSKTEMICKPVLISIKPSDQAACPPQSPISFRKYSASPTQSTATVAGTGSGSNSGSNKFSNKPVMDIMSPSSSQSPKMLSMSPIQHNSPKASSGKPSMSALKCAVSPQKHSNSSSNSSGSSKLKSGNNIEHREKRESSNSSQSTSSTVSYGGGGHGANNGSPKIMPPTIKIKSVDSSVNDIILSAGNSDGSTSQIKNNKRISTMNT